MSMRASGHNRADMLAIVAKYPEPGQVKTRLGAVSGFERAATLYSAFLRDLTARFDMPDAPWTLHWAVAPSARPVESLREFVGATARVFPQRGADFAERLYHICADARALGARRVAIMSSDAPQLPAALAKEAFAALQDYDVAISPAEDGGYSLIALRLPAAPAPPPDLFRGIRMSTPTVFAETYERARTLGLRIHQLATTFDVDEAADVGRLWRALCATPALAPHTYAALAELRASGVSGITEIIANTGNEDTHDGIVSR